MLIRTTLLKFEKIQIHLLYPVIGLTNLLIILTVGNVLLAVNRAGGVTDGASTSRGLLLPRIERSIPLFGFRMLTAVFSGSGIEFDEELESVAEVFNSVCFGR